MKCYLVIPSFRDGDRLRNFLPELCQELVSMPDVCIRVVDDGSGAAQARETKAVVEGLRPDFKMLLETLQLEQNQGKGGAIYSGWEAAPEAEWLAFVDADGAIPAREVRRLLETALDPGTQYDVMIASRVMMLGRTVSRTLSRHLIGRVYATLSNIASGLVVYDSQCGCKVVRRSSYERVRPSLVERRFAFDMELLVSLACSGARISEFPVDWSDIPGSKVSLFKDSVRMFVALRRLRGRIRASGCAGT